MAIGYSNSLVYKLCCNDLGVKGIYIGSTTNFTRGKCAHKSVCNNPNSPLHNQKVYKSIRESGGWGNWDMVLLEQVGAKSKLDLHRLEGGYIESLAPTLNTKLPPRSMAEYETAEQRKKYRKEWSKGEKAKAYAQSGKRKEYMIKYRKSEKAKAYEQSDERKQSKAKYMQGYNSRRYEQDKHIRSQPAPCGCGATVRVDNMLRHIKARKHRDWVASTSHPVII